MQTPILEKRSHGTDMLNLAVYDHSLVDPVRMGLHIPIHWHPEYEVIYVHRGEPTFDVAGTSYNLKPGQALFINRNVIHSCPDMHDLSIHYTCVVFGESFLFPSSEDGVFFAHFVPLHQYEVAPPVLLDGATAWEREILFHVRQLVEVVLCGAPGFALHTRARLMDILYILLREDAFLSVNRRAGDRADPVRAAILIIQQNYRHELSVRELAASLNLCHEYFSRLFRQMTGIAPKAYIINYRIDRAAHLLVSGDLDVTQIAGKCGFEDVNYFSRCFKRIRGVSPTQYRKSPPAPAGLQTKGAG